MVKESRIMVRLIALWVICIVALGLFCWAGWNLSTSVIKAKNGGYENYMVSGYNNSCVQYPSLPPMEMGTYQTPEAKAQSDKYMKDLEKYNADFTATCKADLEKQEISRKNQEKSALIGDVTGYSILTVLGLLVMAGALKMIRLSEVEA